MITIEEHYIDTLTEKIFRLLKGEIPESLKLPADFPENEVKQTVTYFNKFLTEYREFSDFIFSISQGKLDFPPPASKIKVMQATKSLQSNLRHLTWKTIQIAGGDFNQKIDFIGDFSAAFNQMTLQLKQAFEEIKQKNEELFQMNEEISAQRDEIESQHAKLSKQQKDILASIAYASRIQKALLPEENILKENVTEYFIFYLPRDIVSGDFYWFAKIDEKLIVVAADCTGHGVPGAFMSMLGVSFLNQIVIESKIIEPAKALNELRNKVKISLSQTGKRGESQDGMDIAFCTIDLITTELQFAGAYNSLFLYRKNFSENIFDFIEIKADRMPIGVHPRDNQDFTNHSITLQEKDRFYIFSDGYASQFGGEKVEKFKTKGLQELLLNIQNENLTSQNEILTKTFFAWKRHLEQMDDILVIGIEI